SSRRSSQPVRASALGATEWALDYGTCGLRKSRVSPVFCPTWPRVNPAGGMSGPSGPQVGGPHVGVGSQGSGRIPAGHDPRLEHVGAVGDAKGLVGELLDQEDRGALGGQAGNDLEDLAHKQ